MACILLSWKAAAVFSPSYREVVDRTPYLDPPGAFDNGRTLRLTVRNQSHRPTTVAFRFATAATAGERKHWAGRIAVLAGRPADRAAPDGDVAFAEPTPVVLLRQRPPARYQLLGTVEAKSDKRRTAEGGLVVRAAMMGADAIVDLQEEFLPDFGRTARRLTGTAVRAVDSEGRFEFRSRWYADRIARVSKWSLALLAVSLFLTVVSSIATMTVVATLAAPNRETIASDLLKQARPSILFIAAAFVWPIVLASLARGLRWPQFVRPLALTLVAFALSPIYLLIGLVSGTLFARGGSGLIYHALWFLDPIGLSINLLILVYSLFLARAAWRADKKFRSLVPDVGRVAPLRRSLGGRLAWSASVAYAALLAGVIITGCFFSATQFRLPASVNRQAAAALAELQSAVALQMSDPARAEGHFRRAIPLWEELVREVPSELDYPINLQLTRTLLALSAGAQGRLAEAREPLTRSGVEWEALASGTLPAPKRAIVDLNRNLIRSALRSIEFALEFGQGQALWKANDMTGAEAAFRRALEAVLTSPGARRLPPHFGSNMTATREPPETPAFRGHHTELMRRRSGNTIPS